MGFISIVQGAALPNSYRALVLGRELGGSLRISAVSTAGGTSGESVRLTKLAPPSLASLLTERKLGLYLLDATKLRSERGYRFDFSDDHGNATYLETYTLPNALPQDGLTFAVGSCFYEGFNMGGRVGDSLRQVRLGTRPLFQFWAGDNLYVDVPAFGLFAGNRPFEQTLERYLDYFEKTAYMTSRALTPNYTTYDDHELWNNFPEHQVWLSRSSASQRGGYSRAAWACLDLFQASLNPPRAADGRSFQFDLAPLSFFFADVRTNRELYDGGRGRMMTSGDLRALGGWAENLSGPGVLVIGQPLWMRAGGKTDFNPPSFQLEYRTIWAALRKAAFDILVISGDVHHSRVLEISLGNAPGRMVYEFVSSPASHIPTELTTVLPWEKQGTGNLSLPGSVIDGGERAKAKYFFGTERQNTLGLLRFVPKTSSTVSVSAAFVDYGGSNWPVFPKSLEVSELPLARHKFARCAGAPLFDLRRRPA